MREIKASEFKAKCLKLLDQVAETGEAIVITKRGKVVARLEADRPASPRSLFGMFKGQIEIVDPNDDLEIWDAEMERAFEAKLDRIAADLAHPVKRGKRGRRG